MVFELATAKLVETLGSKVAETAFSYWIKRATTRRSTLQLVETDLRAQAEGERGEAEAKQQFAEIGEKIARDLAPLFTNARSLDEGERTAVIAAAAEVLSVVDFSPDLLVGVRYDAGMLTDEVLGRRPGAIASLNEDGRRLYERVVRQACQAIVYVALALPGYEPRVVKELLDGKVKLVERADESLSLLRQIWASIPAQSEAAERFESAYRPAMQRSMERLELVGVGQSREAIVRFQRVTASYVTLRVAPKDAGGQTASQSLASVTAPAIDELLATSGRLLVRGLAGSGKTTVLQWLGVRAAAQDFVGPLAHWNARVPFFVRLSKLVSGPLPSPSEFPRLQVPEIAGTCPAGWVEQHLDTRGLVLVDGLDELSSKRRDQVLEWLIGLVEAYPRSLFVLTSRPDPTSESRLALSGFERIDILPLDADTIPRFVDHWHRALRETPGVSSEDLESLDALASGLKQRLAASRALQSLATVPLLCALLCVLNRDRRSALPNRRVELYRQCAEMLATRRDLDRYASTEAVQASVLSDYPALDEVQTFNLLQDLAYHMLVNGYSSVGIRAADAQFQRTLSNITDAPVQATGTAVRKFLVDRSGLLYEYSKDAIGFRHPVFLEFFAAKSVLDEDNLDQLLMEVSRPTDDPRWREVAVLAAGLATKRSDRLKLIGDLLTRGDASSELRQRLHLLAAYCLAEASRKEPELADRVDAGLQALVPPVDDDAAASLAAVGDLAVRYLLTPALDEQHALASIRTLMLIGSEAARNALVAYATDARPSVQAAGSRALGATADQT